MKNLKETLEALFDEHVLDERLFLVHIAISKGKMNKVKLVVDGDEGITINQCAEISRKIGYQLETQEVIDNAYTLEVTSPGIDQPLQMQRQYPKNIGRKLKIKMQNGDTRTGVLEAVNEVGIQIAEEIKEKVEGKKKKQVVIHQNTIAFEEMKEVKVAISFG